MSRFSICSLRWAVAGAIMAATTSVQAAAAQGCMPLKFLSPGFAGLQSRFLDAHEWQLSISGRRVATSKFFVGSSEDEAAAPGGQPLYLHLNSIDLAATYALTNRVTVTGSIPFSYSTASNFNPDGARHQVASGGIGDVNLMFDGWVLDPGAHVNGNIVIGLGAKAPTGSNHSTDNFWLPGQVIQQPVPQTIQEGDGGWALLAELQGFQHLAGLTSVYASGQYSASLRQHTDVVWAPANEEWAVPDVYSARAGFSLAVDPHHGLSLSAGGRIDGTAIQDIFHKHGDYYRHAGYTVYLEPGLSWLNGRDQFTVTVPIRLRQQYFSMYSTTQGWEAGTGGANNYLIYASYSRRF